MAESTYKGEERRDPRRATERMRLRPEDMAALVYDRRFSGEVTNALDEEQFAPLEIKEALKKFCDRLECKLTPEQLVFRESLESQAGAAASVWTERFPIENGPSQVQLETGAHEWLQSLTQQVLEGFRTLCPDTASLVVVPDLPVPALLELLKTGKVPIEIWWDFWKSVKATKWTVGITGGAEDIPFDASIRLANEGEGIKRTNEQMVALSKRRFEAHGLEIMPPHGYVPSAARALAEGRGLDWKFYTAFEKPEGEARLPVAGWAYSRLGLGRGNPDNSDDAIFRCRPWVEATLKF